MFSIIWSKSPLNWLPRLDWVLNNADYTDMFQEYRERSLFLSVNKQNLSNNRVLSLSNVFVVSKNQPDSSIHRFRSTDFAYLRDYLNPKEDWEMLPPKARLWCSQLDQLIHSSDDFPIQESRKLIRDFEGELYPSDNADDRLVMFCSILSKLMAAFDTWLDNFSLENAFTEHHLSPFIKDIFKRVNIDMRLGEIHICNNPLLYFSDYVGSYKDPPGSIYDILTVEIKPPKKFSES
jgi:hypothetical protein